MNIVDRRALAYRVEHRGLGSSPRVWELIWQSDVVHADYLKLECGLLTSNPLEEPYMTSKPVSSQTNDLMSY